MKLIILIIIDIDKQGQNGTTIFNILDNTTELWVTNYIIGDFFSSGGATLYKNSSDQTVLYIFKQTGDYVNKQKCKQTLFIFCRDTSRPLSYPSADPPPVPKRLKNPHTGMLYNNFNFTQK